MQNSNGNQARLILEPAQKGVDGNLRLAASLLEADGTAYHLWWETQDAFANAITPLLRPFLPVRNAIRQWTRGSTLSRSQLAAQAKSNNRFQATNRP